MLVLSVLVELLEEVRILVAVGLGRSLILVLHLEHDRDDLCARGVVLAEDIVALGASHDVVVLVELGVPEAHHAPLVELHLAVLLERLADELRREAGTLVPEPLYLILLVLDEDILVAELLHHLLPERRLGLLALCLGLLDLPLEPGNLLLKRRGRLSQGQRLLACEGLFALLCCSFERCNLLVAVRERKRLLVLIGLLLCLGFGLVCLLFGLCLRLERRYLLVASGERLGKRCLLLCLLAALGILGSSKGALEL